MVNIEAIRSGDTVLARHEETGEWGWFVVERTFVRTARELIELEIVGETGAPDLLQVTPEHPMRVASGEWVEAGELALSDRLVGFAGDIRIVSIRRFTEDAIVFNLEVRTAHTYFVGETGAWVHNAGPGGVCGLLKPGPKVSMFREALERLNSVPSNEKASAFDDLAAQISRGATDGAWFYERVAIRGGDLFVGAQGEALVITKGGAVYRGSEASGGISEVGLDAAGAVIYDVDYSLMTRLQ
jgi:hypothetical protein